MARPRVEFENAKLDWINFGGRAIGQNPLGARNFKIRLDHDQAQQFEEDGYLVSWDNNVKPGEEPDGLLKVHVSYQFESPIVMVTTFDASGAPIKQESIEEELVHTLDDVEISQCDVICNVATINRAGAYKGKKSLYLKEIYIGTRASNIASKWANLVPGDEIQEQDLEPDETPWN